MCSITTQRMQNTHQPSLPGQCPTDANQPPRPVCPLPSPSNPSFLLVLSLKSSTSLKQLARPKSSSRGIPTLAGLQRHLSLPSGHEGTAPATATLSRPSSSRRYRTSFPLRLTTTSTLGIARRPLLRTQTPSHCPPYSGRLPPPSPPLRLSAPCADAQLPAGTR